MAKDKDEGVSPTVSESALGALLDSEPQLLPQHWKAPKGLGEALCGSFGPQSYTRIGVTCVDCRRALAKPRKTRAPRLTDEDGIDEPWERAMVRGGRR